MDGAPREGAPEEGAPGEGASGEERQERGAMDGGRALQEEVPARRGGIIEGLYERGRK